MSGHSKGPWTLDEEGDAAANFEIYDADNWNIGRAFPGHERMSAEEVRANGLKMAAAPELVEALREIVLWVGATAELLATVPLPQGGHSRTLIDAIEGGRAWARDGSKAKAALKKAGVEP